MDNYLEFLATRKVKEGGLDLVTDEHAVESAQYTKFKRDALKILNRFSYDTYERTAGFLLYSEALKRFVVVRADKGEQVDQRLNMQLTLRIPVDLRAAEDGFDFCLCQLWQWECGGDLPEWYKNPEKLSGFGENFGFDQNHLEAFLTKWLRYICAQQGEAIRITDSVRGLGAETAVWIAAMAYRFLPEGRKNRYTFACFGRPEKCRGFCIQATGYPFTGNGIDLAVRQTPVEDHMDAPMIRAAAEQFLAGTDTEQLPKQIDWYYVKANDYDSLVWNFYYYRMDRNEPLRLTEGIFQELQERLKKQQHSGLEKTEELYGWLLTQSMKQEGQIGQEIRLQMYLEFMNRKEKYTEEQIKELWRQLSLYAQEQGGQEMFRRVLEQIRGSSSRLYYALICYGISSGKIGSDERELERFLELQDVRSAAGLQEWMDRPEHRSLMTEERVRELLIRKIGARMTAGQSLKEIQNLVVCGGMIDKKKCLNLIRGYLAEGTKPFLETLDLCGWRDYLLEREKLWKRSPALLRQVSEQYEAFSGTLKVPMPSKQMEALIGMGDLLCRFEQERKRKADFDACTRAVRKVYHVFLEQFLRKCRTTSDGEQREELLDNMKRFLAWHPSGQENSLSYRQAVDLYNNMARMSSRQRIRDRSLNELLGYQIWKETPDVREEYRVWLQAVADKVRNIHEVEDVLVQLEKRRKDISRYCSMDSICLVLYRMLALCRGQEGVYWQVKIMDTASKFGETPESDGLCREFWSGIGISDFPAILDSEGDAGHFSDILDWENEMICRLYRIYRSFRKERAGDQTARSVYEMRDLLPESLAAEFFQLLFQSCQQGERRRTEKFGEIYDLMLAYWDEEDRVIQCIESMHLSDRMKDQILNKFEKAYEEQDRKRRQRYLPADIFSGFQLGGILGFLSCVWCMLDPFDLAPLAVTVVVLLMAGIVIAAYFCRAYMKELKTVAYPALVFALGVWVFQLFLLKLTRDVRLPAMLVSILFAAMGTVGLILQRKRGRQNG